MIIDNQKNYSLYPFGELWEKAFKFIENISPDIKDGKYEIEGDDLFAGINTYMTKQRDKAKLETHNKYIDIQILLEGTECIEVFQKAKLTTLEKYDTDKDAEFFNVPKKPDTCLTLSQGQFAVFFPEDAHMPSLNTDDTSQHVKKLVIKIRADKLV